MGKQRGSPAPSNPFLGGGSNPFLGGSGGASTFGSTPISPLSSAAPPPDLHGLPSALLVAFKSLSKQNETTKTRALEDILSWLQSATSNDVDEVFLVAFGGYYTRLATDVGRRVRVLAQTVLAAAAGLAGKRVAPLMPVLISTLLLSLHDPDRTVSRTALTTFTSVFPDPQKQTAVYRVYHRTILTFCIEVLLRETVNSMSDERYVTPEDAESKYGRVVMQAMGVVGVLLAEIEEGVRKKEEDNYVELLSSEKFWDFAQNSDPYVRRATLSLIRAFCQHWPALLEPHLPSTFVTKALSSKPTTANDQVLLLVTLIDITRAFPTYWASASSTKKPILARLTKFLGYGSADWSKTVELIDALPAQDITLTTMDAVTGILDAVWACVTKETKAGWKAAFEGWTKILLTLLPKLSSAEEQGKVVEEKSTPVLVSQIIFPESQSSSAISALASALSSLPADVARKCWSVVTRKLLEAVKGGGLERREWDAQVAVRSAGEHWCTLAHQIILQSADLKATVQESTKEIFKAGLVSVKEQRGFPAGVTSVIDALWRTFPTILSDDEELTREVDEFAQDDIPALVTSLSGSALLSILVTYVTARPSEVGAVAWTRTVKSVLASSDVGKKEKLVGELFDGAGRLSSGQVPVLDEMEAYLKEKAGDMEFVKTAVKAEGILISRGLAVQILSDLLSSLRAYVEEAPERAVKIVQLVTGVAKVNHELLALLLQTPESGRNLSYLLTLTDSPHSDLAAAVKEAKAVLGGAAELKSQVGDAVVQSLLEQVQHPTLEDHTVAKVLAERVVEASRNAGSDSMLFAAEAWEKAIEVFAQRHPSAELALTNGLGHAAHSSGNAEEGQVVEVERDGRGFSAFLNMAIFAQELLKKEEYVKSIGSEARVRALVHIAICVEMVKDQLDVHDVNGLWTGSGKWVEEEMMAFEESYQEILTGVLAGTDDWSTLLQDGTEAPSLAIAFVKALMTEAKGASPTSFYVAKSLHGVLSSLSDSALPRPLAESLLKSSTPRTSPDIFRSIAILKGLQRVLAFSPVMDRLRNEMASDLSGVKRGEAEEKGYRLLVLVNASIPTEGEGEWTQFPQQRTMFLVQNVLRWYSEADTEGDLTAAVHAEVARLFLNVLPIIGGVYGGHWETLLGCISSWLQMCETQESDILPLEHAALKLFAAIKACREENDDISDAWAGAQTNLYERLLEVFLRSNVGQTQSQPRNLGNGLLTRLIDDMPLYIVLDNPAKADEVYTLVHASPFPTQRAAYRLLRESVVSRKEELVIRVATAREEDGDVGVELPGELLSIILDAPDASLIDVAENEEAIPAELRGYCFAWKLIFDHLEETSYRVKARYVEFLKEGEFVHALLNLIAETLHLDTGRAIDVSKMDVERFALEETESPADDLRKLMAHLYFTGLTHLPSLVRQWWTDSKNRQLTLTVESFTEKHFSSIIVQHELTNVQNNINQSELKHENMQIRVAKAAREVAAVYEVDGMPMEMVIRLPGTYPLRQVEIEGSKKIGVKDAQWRAWLLASQSVITSQNGTMIDALILFKRNITLHFEGVEDCAICYSVLSIQERSLPNKKCGTCKNKFHASCLYKWFKSSNGSSCPLCRTSFSFGN
ncbi:hypothetical protein SAICODRAFT_5929 [Saitoella complicata NRRL Y-17804]|uniref:uncharacterized protein n=1 Tax=Saitoella complicata (strain BCRC 22490 / CBS 7301 / JCM 7358 / NBRC 10748 / NRRL Y-17804) TaxID=698492 RepID=UPI0008679370|nr:uncharacterized protein SAICODRAFT_5929 [Saitoella complicata NRRL Y-17804]ODQ54733.1 hypothetical protein SAICODRAFT_5929 [Saitoella complicata NRRL Y-17804]